MQVYIYDLFPTNVRATAAGLAYNGGTWLVAWAAIITTMMACASQSPGPWLMSIVIITLLGAVLMIISFALAGMSLRR